MEEVISLLNFEGFFFFIQIFKEITQILFQVCLTTWKKYCHSMTQIPMYDLDYFVDVT